MISPMLPEIKPNDNEKTIELNTNINKRQFHAFLAK